MSLKDRFIIFYNMPPTKFSHLIGLYIRKIFANGGAFYGRVRQVSCLEVNNLYNWNQNCFQVVVDLLNRLFIRTEIGRT